MYVLKDQAKGSLNQQSDPIKLRHPWSAPVNKRLFQAYSGRLKGFGTKDNPMNWYPVMTTVVNNVSWAAWDMSTWISDIRDLSTWKKERTWISGTRPRMEKSHSGYPRTALCVVNMSHQNGMSPLIRTNASGTMFYSILFCHLRPLYRRLKYMNSVISVTVDSPPDNTMSDLRFLVGDFRSQEKWQWW